jgi:hypothetical protein
MTMRLLLIALFIEVGLVLSVVPWSTYWERNYFVDGLPLLQSLLTNDFVRGAVSGLGLVNIGAGIAELFSLFAARRVQEPIVTIGSSILEDK